MLRNLKFNLSFIQVASYLIRRGSDVNSLDVDGASALHHACSAGHLDLMSFLIKSGGYLSLERMCDRTLILDMLKREPLVSAKNNSVIFQHLVLVLPISVAQK